ncbi:helix-turn-helix transcriptional regulator [Silvimonas amylolytica]|uniref:Transcriptional regulator n=1 Tax=Silvimonas amylolytica TaxID=449663 RepID=A0ABQ2PRS3_9NEIS|nr:LuxR C-terminal-related transcriptional regulator [Silvimonas amylolytica]GGP27969.1 transcriptional regulator [Silvimonas amylolytica]
MTPLQQCYYRKAIEHLYAWPEDFDRLNLAMSAIAQLSGAGVGHYVAVDLATRQLTESCITVPALIKADQEYRDYFGTIDPRIEWYINAALAQWRCDQDRYDLRFVRQNEFYNDYLIHYGFCRTTATVLRRTERIVECVVLVKARDAPDYTASSLQLLSCISSHMVRAAHLRARLRELEAQQKASEQTLSVLPFGVVWLDQQGQVCWMNASARCSLASSDGLGIRQNKLFASNTNVDRLLQLALRQSLWATPRTGQALRVNRRDLPWPLLVSILPMTRPTGEACGVAGQGPCALVIIQDTAIRAMTQPHLLAQMFGLTPAEVRLAQALLENTTVEEFATSQGVSRTTVRTHLAHLFAKTGTSRQAELVRMLGLIIGFVTMDGSNTALLS